MSQLNGASGSMPQLNTPESPRRRPPWLVLSLGFGGLLAFILAAAIGSLGQVDKRDPAVESQLIAYLKDPDSDIREVALVTLADRGDPAAIGPIEDQLRAGTPWLGSPNMVERQLERLRRSAADNGQIAP